MPGHPRDVLDLGAGTGKLTAALVAPGRTVIAIDPSPVMLQRLTQAVPQVTTIVGTAEATGLRGGSIDAVLAGAAFHWFTRPDADAEIARVLRPGGSACLLWNPIDPADQAYRPFAQARARIGLPRLEFDPQVELDRRWFGSAQRRQFTQTITVTVDQYVQQLASRSYILALSDTDRAAALTAARDFARAAAAGGTFAVRYRTTAIRAIRTPLRRPRPGPVSGSRRGSHR
jgi:ubiquinone/menaquinone biosynthesis C-methylase UbiE